MTIQPYDAYIALGGNVGDTLSILQQAAKMLVETPSTGMQFVQASPIYKTRPIGPSSEPFLNAIMRVRTSRVPKNVLSQLLQIEQDFGRVREVKWGPRTLDLDFICAVGPSGQITHNDASLTLPHPHLTARDFVLVPLCHVAPGIEIRGDSIRNWSAKLPEQERTILEQLPEALLSALKPDENEND